MPDPLFFSVGRKPIPPLGNMLRAESREETRRPDGDRPRGSLGCRRPRPCGAQRYDSARNSSISWCFAA